MSFKATFQDSEKHNIWFRTVSALTTVRKDINFTITSAELIAWAINTTDTTLCQVRFARSFFEDYEFKPYEIVFGEDGVQIVPDSHGTDQKLYSFEVNGRHLTTISKKPDGDSVNEFTIAINNTASCPDVLANRLLIHIEMSSLISKDYTPQFTPIKYDPIVIDLKYKRKFLDVYGSKSRSVQETLNHRLSEIFVEAERELSTALFNENNEPNPKDMNQLTMADEINLVCCNQALIKNFLDNCNPNITEEMKLEISHQKLCVTAFTKAIYGKNNDVLRNNISLSNTISTSDLECHCLFLKEINNGDKGDDGTKSIVFKLKDFKNFMSIGSSGKSSLSGNLNIWFCHRGEPLLVELNRPDVKSELVQITDSSGMANAENENAITKATATVSPNTRASREPFKAEPFLPRVSPLKSSSVPSKETRRSPLKNMGGSIPNKSSITRQLFVKEDDEHPLSVWNHEEEELKREQPEPNEEILLAAPAERSRTTVGWGQRPLEPDHSLKPMDKQSMLKQEKRKYLQELKDEQKRQKREINDRSTQESQEGLGPTQPNRPKGLFD
ncbi:hypothetical protein ZYGR_0AD01140 [Zygosaccharomyces rouxii]|uniref:DNA damage checkpoint protein 1 n=2 Tax=Zygosaccharomyces rouxii TaxID=4956 RepID=C5DZZ8_ZYGRC|nr:uncharacterized protein ZYRO0G08492g [Zygosaccharomyces rouxii]KAH9202426.1 hypothetical protein LQ764DRAFT_21126 [Zygosaccharomyces rouxii]GAV50931.1 hypothetical protein ZYGR_0AD01140 [Zygosaccharomyces rouxii]CAR29432.1 ZYRO0G08492p [Zygosaccharomyces rouxii]